MKIAQKEANRKGENSTERREPKRWKLKWISNHRIHFITQRWGQLPGLGRQKHSSADHLEVE